MHRLQKPCFTPKGFVSFLWDLWDHTFPPSAKAVFPSVRGEASAQSKEWSWEQGGEDRGSHWSPFNLSHSTEWARLGQNAAFREPGTSFWPQKDLKSEKGAQLLADGGSFLSRGHSRQPHPARSPSRQLCST